MNLPIKKDSAVLTGLKRMEERKRQGELKQLQEEGAAFVPTSPRSSLVPQVHEQFDRPWPMPRV
jgi:hypothetical protein